MGWEPLQSDDNLSNGTYRFTDTRDGEVYIARNFGTMTGHWMLENLRYVPNAIDGYSNYTHNAGSSSSTNKQFAYSTPEGVYVTAEQPKADWDKKNGLLYNWVGATNNENASTSNQGQTANGEDPVTTPIRGICPQGWHLPSDKEWNDLERAIYSNPMAYSTYKGPSAIFIPAWNPVWETNMSTRGSNLDTLEV